MHATGSKEEDAEPSRRRLRSTDTLETVVVRCGGGSWPEADCGPPSTEQQWCTDFWSSQISSVPAGWYLQWRCGEWPSAGRVCSGSESPPVPSSGSKPLRCQTDRNWCLRKGGAPSGFQICQSVARNANVRWNPLNVDTGSFTDGGDMRPDWDVDWIGLTGRTSGKCCD